MQKILLNSLGILQKYRLSKKTIIHKTKLSFADLDYKKMDNLSIKIILLIILVIYILLALLMIEISSIINITGDNARISLTAAAEVSPEKLDQDRIKRWAVKNGKLISIKNIKTKYREEIMAAANKQGVSSRVIAAMIAVEWDERNLVSSKGARGQMGLMPLTARAMGVRNINNPGENIMGGTKYLSIQINKYNNLDLALAAYNAGPGNVAKYKGVPPFRETKDYIERVRFLAYSQ